MTRIDPALQAHKDWLARISHTAAAMASDPVENALMGYAGGTVERL
jgi:hypothetical protein